MANQSPNKLTAEEYVALENALGNSALMFGLRKIFASEEEAKLVAMRSEALGQSKPIEIVKLAAESRVCEEWEKILRRWMERLAPQR